MAAGGAGAPPDWFAAALAAPRSVHAVDVPGDDGAACRIEYLRFERRHGAAARRPLVFLHGGSAHAHWWTHLVPFFTDDGSDAIAINFGGMGASQHRAVYSMAGYAREVCACADDAGLVRPVIVAHSFGGFVAATAAAAAPDRFAGVIFVDAMIRPPGQEVDYMSPAMYSNRPRKTYTDLATMRSKFRLVPDDPQENPWIKDHFFKYAYEQKPGGGYQWRYDENRSSLGKVYIHLSLERAVSAGFPFSLIWVAKSGSGVPQTERRPDGRAAGGADREGAAAMAYMRRTLPAGSPFVCIPEATHHVMADQPLALVAAIRALLPDPRFEDARPRRPPPAGGGRSGGKAAL